MCIGLTTNKVSFLELLLDDDSSMMPNVMDLPPITRSKFSTSLADDESKIPSSLGLPLTRSTSCPTLPNGEG